MLTYADPRPDQRQVLNRSSTFMFMTSITLVRPTLCEPSTAQIILMRLKVFASPLPNRQLWKGESIGFLQNQSPFVNGGWWHDAGILGATGGGIEKQEPKAWEGWWNEQIVSRTMWSTRRV